MSFLDSNVKKTIHKLRKINFPVLKTSMATFNMYWMEEELDGLEASIKKFRQHLKEVREKIETNKC